LAGYVVTSFAKLQALVKSFFVQSLGHCLALVFAACLALALPCLFRPSFHITGRLLFFAWRLALGLPISFTRCAWRLVFADELRLGQPVFNCKRYFAFFLNYFGLSFIFNRLAGKVF